MIYPSFRCTTRLHWQQIMMQKPLVGGGVASANVSQREQLKRQLQSHWSDGTAPKAQQVSTGCALGGHDMAWSSPQLPEKLPHVPGALHSIQCRRHSRRPSASSHRACWGGPLLQYIASEAQLLGEGVGHTWLHASRSQWY